MEGTGGVKRGRGVCGTRVRGERTRGRESSHMHASFT